MEAAADDVDIEEDMTHWNEDEVLAFFESGGAVRPAPTANGVFALEAQMIDGTTLKLSELAGKPLLIMNVASK